MIRITYHAARRDSAEGLVMHRAPAAVTHEQAKGGRSVGRAKAPHEKGNADKAMAQAHE